MKYKVYLVGAGPGREDLITVRGLNILKSADVIIYDYLVNKKLLKNAKEDAELIPCKGLNQDEINKLVVKKAKEGKRVIRLKNGDPSIFGRISEELENLVKNKIEFEIVPGVTSASAGSAYTGIPLTSRNFSSSCVFLTGQEAKDKQYSLIDWQAIARINTIVIYMGVNNFSSIIKKLVQAGLDLNTPVAIIKDASLITQRVITGKVKNITSLIRKGRIRPPAIIIIGKVVEQEKKFNWIRKNKKILFTGLSKERFFIKGNYLHIPMIEIKPLEDYREFDNWIKKICHQPSTINYRPIFDWIVFTSRYGVKYFFERLKATGLDTRTLGGIKIAAIGNSTANKLKEYGIIPDLVPKKESSQGLLKEFKKILKRKTQNAIRNTRIFLPRSDISDKGLERGLKSLGANVITSFAYKNVMPKDLPDLDLDFFDEIMFTSPSTVRSFKKRYKKISRDIKVRCIGEVTLKEAKRCRLLD